MTFLSKFVRPTACPPLAGNRRPSAFSLRVGHPTRCRSGSCPHYSSTGGARLPSVPKAHPPRAEIPLMKIMALVSAKLVRPAGIEPAAYWFEANRSIRMSYGRILTKLLQSFCSSRERKPMVSVLYFPEENTQKSRTCTGTYCTSVSSPS